MTEQPEIKDRTSQITEDEVEELSSRKTRKHVRDILEAYDLDNSFSVESTYFSGMGNKKTVEIKNWSRPDDEEPTVIGENTDSDANGLAKEVEDRINEELGIPAVTFKPADGEAFIST